MYLYTVVVMIDAYILAIIIKKIFSLFYCPRVNTLEIFVCVIWLLRPMMREIYIAFGNVGIALVEEQIFM